MKKSLSWQKRKSPNLILSRILVLLAFIATLEIFAGIKQIIEDISPTALGSYHSLQNSFVTHFADHSFIILGALALTLVIWGLTQKFW